MLKAHDKDSYIIKPFVVPYGFKACTIVTLEPLTVYTQAAYYLTHTTHKCILRFRSTCYIVDLLYHDSFSVIWSICLF